MEKPRPPLFLGFVKAPGATKRDSLGPLEGLEAKAAAVAATHLGSEVLLGREATVENAIEGKPVAILHLAAQSAGVIEPGGGPCFSYQVGVTPTCVGRFAKSCA